MSRRLLFGAAVLLLLAGGGAVLRPRRGAPQAPPEGRQSRGGEKAAAGPTSLVEVRRFFPTVEDARRFAVARLWASQGTHPAGDPYSSTFTRRYTSLTGGTIDYYLV